MYWQAKIWGLLHDPALKALHNCTGRANEGAWETLNCMQGWVSPKASSLKTSNYSSNWLKHVGLCDLIASASDRATLGRLPGITAIDYDQEGLEIRHLLSGASQKLKLEQWHHRILDSGRRDFLQGTETALLDNIKNWDDPRKVYWWLWRCYPEALANALGAERHESAIHLLPAETRLPDGSLWSHTTMTSALAGALAGYYKHDSDYPKKRERFIKSRPHIVTFTFTPVQELIKASRKMRDFWAGSWLLHYLCAKICWAIAWKYGPDTLLYPCLYEQPLIDLWLRKQYPDFDNRLIKPPSERQLLTAGFPNVLVFILPDNGASQDETISNPIHSAMQQAEAALKEAWNDLGKRVLGHLQGDNEKWIENLNWHTWDGWLNAQWQTYWTAVPLGEPEAELHHSPRQENLYQKWQAKQNGFTRPREDLFAFPDR